jgi:hypothetical protein
MAAMNFAVMETMMPTELEILRAQVELLREAHTLANGALRSAWQVAERDGLETNWPGFRACLRESLDASHAAINALASIPPHKPEPTWRQ